MPALKATRRLLIAAGAAAFLALALAGGHWLPDWGLRWGVERVLRDLGWSRIGIGAADLSLFNGAIVVRRVVAGAELGNALGIDGLDLTFRWKPLFARRVSVERLDLSGVDVEVRRSGDGFVVNGLPVAVGGPGGGGWSFDITALTLSASRLHLIDGGFKASIAIERLELLDLKSWEPAQPARIRLVGRLDGRRVAIEGTATPFAAKPGFALDVRLDGLNLAAFADLARRAGLAELSGTLTADIAVTGDATGLRAKGDVGIDDFSLAAGSVALAAGSVALKADKVEWGPAFRLDGRVTAKAARLRDGALVVEAQRAAAQGRIADAQGFAPVAGTLGLEAEGLSVRESDRDWLAAARLDGREVILSADGITAARLEAKNLALLKAGGAWRIEARQAHAERAAYGADGTVTAGALTLGGAVLRATRTKAGWVGLEPGGGDSPAVALGRLRLPDAKVEFEDRTPAEPVRLNATALDLTVDALDSSQPDKDAPFSAKARIGAARLAASGMARPFAERPSFHLKGEVKALDLPKLSPYAAEALGVHLHTGQLDAELTLAARQGRLDGALELALAQLFVAQPDPDAPLAKQADMPLETVLDLLRDSDDRIRLSIPVRGDLSNPDFDISDAVNQAIGGALKSTVFTTLKVAFPVAALIGFVIDEAEKTRLSLEPLAFPPGADALGEGERAKLATIGGLLKQRPGLKLRLCGVAGGDDIRAEAGVVAKLQSLIGARPEPDRDRLSGLADARAQAAKAFLVDNAGIDPGRLFTCRPKVEDQGRPRVEMLL